MGDSPAPREMRPATIIDVAREAGVSFKTVSRVLNGEPNVRAPTRERVLEAAGRLGYRANPHARSLRAGQSRLIGVFFGHLSRNYLSELQIGALEKANAAGFSIVFETLKPGWEETGLPPGLSDLAGAVLVPPLSEDAALMARLTEAGTPFVRLSHTDAPAEAGRVSMDDSGAALAMTEYLIGLGHRRIGFITGPANHPQAQLRQSGFEAGLAAHGLQAEPGLIVPGAFDFESGLAAARALLDLPSPPSAIFASNDDMAAGVLAVAYRSRIRVPEELSVAGFDDTPLATTVSPVLTTIYQPGREMAARAVGMLIDRRSEDRGRHIVLPHRLVVRESTAPAPR
ncbi:LacI family DNA-binding transcriptional regulator [Hyphomonas sp.]|uniref:LacI family DNA-binding transcriptional regulator n=1 Tax=Hyphomonas sp. TaxID=87 RepID=UPI0039199159